MPRAPQEIVDKLNNGEDQEGFEPLPEQLYLCTLVEVEEYEAKDANSFDGVILTWQVEQPREFAGEKIRFHRLSYSPRAAFKIREFWDALGYEYNSDFDEAVENQEKAIIDLELTLQKVGKNKGKPQNNVREVLEATPEAIAALPA